MLSPKPFLRESSIAHAVISSRLHTVCDNCLHESTSLNICVSCARMRYCNRACQRAMWKLHKVECKQYRSVQRLPTAQIRLLIRLMFITDNEQRASIDSLMSHSQNFSSDPLFMAAFEIVLKTISEFLCCRLPISESEIFKLYCQIQINSFMITDATGADLAPGVFKKAASLDHSCFPNLEYIFQGRNIVCISLNKTVLPNEARINYVDPLASTAQRRSELQSRYFFHCECPLCLNVERDEKITALICCLTGSNLQPVLPIPQTPATTATAGDLCHIPSSSFSDVRECCICGTRFNGHQIRQVTTQLSTFQHNKSENIMDALVLYHRLRGIEGPVSSRTLQSDNLLCPAISPDSFSYYQLFGHKSNVYLAQVCRAASSGMLEEHISCLFDAFGSDETTTRMLVNSLIACGLDLLHWQSTWLPWPAFASGLHACTLAGFLLRWLLDADFTCGLRMQQIKQICASEPDEANLAQVLCKLILVADSILSPFAPYDDVIASALRRLNSHL
ncbi:SET and MYND domain-containing protein [Paragonimus westermani]|uniref:SET and MYND domain-containing protein n=1 Tax=Paragonimus westermani TaxID=34504 RepID=A0A5J4P3E7_9TREM|nr:SET and MYND domain-containing protein [Paragonimus westermani]